MQGRVAAAIRPEVERHVLRFREAAISQMLGEFTGGSLTAEKAFGYVGQLVAYRQIVTAFEKEIAAGERAAKDFGQ